VLEVSIKRRPMTMAEFEKTKQDRDQDRRSGLKEGSPAEQRQDRAALNRINRSRGRNR